MSHQLRLKPEQFEVPEGAPFKNDSLNREPIAQALTELSRKCQDSCILAINSPWGTGKSTFLKMWAQQLANSRIPHVIFSAWEHDFSEDALACLIGELSLTFKSQRSNQGALKRVKKASLGLIKISTPILIKAATMGMLDVDKDWEKLWGDLAQKHAEEQIKNYEKAKISLTKFKAELTAYIQRISSDGEKGQLVIIVDELDRCRPTFAIDVLERAKHFFDVKGVTFVFAIDRTQLAKSIQVVYGDIDTEEYLRRFFDFEITLPEPDLPSFVKSMCSRYGITKELTLPLGGVETHSGEIFIDMFSEFIARQPVSLRQVERSISLYALAFLATPSNELPFSNILSLLLALKFTAPDLYRSLKEAKQPPDNVWDYLMTISHLAKMKDQGWLIVIRAMLWAAHPNESDWEALLHRSSPPVSHGPGTSTFELAQSYDKYRRYHGFDRHVMAKLFKRIELLEKVTQRQQA